VEKVDQMINLVGELVITQAMLTETVSGMDRVMNERLVNGLAQLERNTRDLQESVMSVRMMPINFVFSRFPRVVRDLAAKLDKKIQLKTVGEGTELDKGLIEKISDPLTHLVRNSLDHGVESPEERIAKGKDPTGTITLRAAHQGGNIVIEVEDDGAGLNREKILAKAREKGIPFSENISDADVWLMIFAPGFSTAEIVTDVSGRGVGMDVVKRNIEGSAGASKSPPSRGRQHHHHPPAADSGDPGRAIDCRRGPNLHRAAQLHQRIPATRCRRYKERQRAGESGSCPRGIHPDDCPA
jgi:two-component system chemotaxis sensor kinase CheA